MANEELIKLIRSYIEGEDTAVVVMDLLEDCANSLEKADAEVSTLRSKLANYREQVSILYGQISKMRKLR